MQSGLLRLGGVVLVFSGIAGIVAGVTHPQGGVGHDYHQVVASMLGSAQWPVAHWVALVYAICTAWSLWLLLDGGWIRDHPVAWAGARLATIAGLFMAIEFAVELASRVEAGAYAAGQPASLVALVEPMQAVGWPALGLGYGLLALGAPISAPLVVRLVGAAGGAAFAVGGVLVEGFHLASFGPLFAVGGLSFFWLIWSGARILFAPRRIGQSAIASVSAA